MPQPQPAGDRPTLRVSRILRWLVFTFLGAMAWIGLGLVIVVLWSVYVAPYHVVIEKQTFKYEGRTGQPGLFRIAFFSDLELKGLPGRKESLVLDRVRRISPDLVAIGGDLWGGSAPHPAAEELRAFGGWLEEIAAAAGHGAVLVLGEQDIKLREKMQPFLPSSVRLVEDSQAIIPAGKARIRICGLNGHFSPLKVEEGQLRGWAGWAPTLAWYRQEDARTWSSIDVTARLMYSLPGDGPGIAVLVRPGEKGTWLRISPRTSQWEVSIRERGWRGQNRQAGGLPSRTWVKIRIRVAIDDKVTVIQSKAWPEDQSEPAGWPIHLERSGPRRPLRGSVGVLLGGLFTSHGLHRWDDLHVRSSDGDTLLMERFDDPERFSEQWSIPCGPPDSFDATILLLHSPYILLELGTPNFINLALAGHTHGGQVLLPPFGAIGVDRRLPYGWISGRTRLYKKRMDLYVGRGIGVSDRLPARLFCPPEVTEITLRITPWTSQLPPARPLPGLASRPSIIPRRRAPVSILARQVPKW
ncbi:MAG: hypothetical protein ACE5HD_04225 [Acidobacteriota bacterium]